MTVIAHDLELGVFDGMVAHLDLAIDNSDVEADRGPAGTLQMDRRIRELLAEGVANAGEIVLRERRLDLRPRHVDPGGAHELGFLHRNTSNSPS
jgi:hypothetical protein